MFTLKQGSDTLVIVLHEIYGFNRHMEHVCKQWYAAGKDVMSLNLLNREPFESEQEQEAYQYFMKQVGFERPVDEVLRLAASLRDEYRHIWLVGYSVGATIAWLCSTNGLFDRVVAYYGSRIREYTDIAPLCPTLLIYGKQEASFDLEVLLSQLQIIERVRCYQTDAEHGFANPYASNYDRKAADQAWEQAERFVNQITD